MKPFLTDFHMTCHHCTEVMKKNVRINILLVRCYDKSQIVLFKSKQEEVHHHLSQVTMIILLSAISDNDYIKRNWKEKKDYWQRLLY